MGLYGDHILPRAVALAMGGKGFREQRLAALAGVRGRVLELGFGSGHNLAFYPEGVTEVLALEPALLNRKLAAKRIAASSLPVQWVGLRGEEIPLDANSVDSVASTWTMCTIPNLAATLKETRRVLAPSGKLHFIEHGLSADPGVARWQRRLNPIQKIWAGGCHLDRKIDEAILGAGFEIEKLENFHMHGPKVATYLYRGVARPGE
jgi:SAM-dependent methyltransferase